MSTSPELTPVRPDDELVAVLSEWLTFGGTTEELRTRLQEIDRSSLHGEAAVAVGELLEELSSASRDGSGHIEQHVRETLDAVALGS
jgi:hypothetical protein